MSNLKVEWAENEGHGGYRRKQNDLEWWLDDRMAAGLLEERLARCQEVLAYLLERHIERDRPAMDEIADLVGFDYVLPVNWLGIRLVEPEEAAGGSDG